MPEGLSAERLPPECRLLVMVGPMPEGLSAETSPRLNVGYQCW